MVKNRKPKKINRQIMEMTIIVVIAAVGLQTIINGLYMERMNLRAALDKYAAVCDAAGEYFNEQIEQVENEINRLVFDEAFQTALMNYVSNPADYGLTELENCLSNSIVISNLYSSEVLNIIIFDTEGNYLTSMHSYENSIMPQDLREKTDEKRGRAYWKGTHIDAHELYAKSRRILSVSKVLYGYKTSFGRYYGKQLGYALVNISEEDFYQKILKMSYGQNNRLFVVDADNKILSPQQNNMEETLPIAGMIQNGTTQREIVENRQAVLYASENKSTGWRILNIIFAADLIGSHQSVLANVILTALLMILLGGVIMSRLSKRISLPLTEVEEQMMQVEKGKFDISFTRQQYSVKEINHLVHCFEIMSQRLQSLVENVYEAGKREEQMKLEITEAKLNILQNQLNPHFLYNTLDSVSWMALMSGNPDISQMVNDLGDILRTSVKMDNFVTSVAEELQILEKYIYIQKVRYTTKLDFDVEAEEETRGCEILKFMLQPLVENSIVHGMKGTGESLCIRVRVFIDGSWLVSQVMDNGNGISQVDKEQMFLKKKDRVAAQAGHTGTGCFNVYTRLQLVYKEQFLCEVEGSVGNGMCTTIKIPLRQFS